LRTNQRFSWISGLEDFKNTIPLEREILRGLDTFVQLESLEIGKVKNNRQFVRVLSMSVKLKELILSDTNISVEALPSINLQKLALLEYSMPFPSFTSPY
jgi:hypothetical protein